MLPLILITIVFVMVHTCCATYLIKNYVLNPRLGAVERTIDVVLAIAIISTLLSGTWFLMEMLLT